MPDSVREKMLARFSSTARPVVAEANRILDATPDPEYWHLPDTEVVKFTFPGFDHDQAVIHQTPRMGRNMHQADPEVSSRGLLRMGHKNVYLVPENTDGEVDAETRFLLVTGTSHELCPGRMSTMGQFFRYDSRKQSIRVGTGMELLTVLTRICHVDAWDGLVMWVKESLRTWECFNDTGCSSREFTEMSNHIDVEVAASRERLRIALEKERFEKLVNR